MHCGVVIIIIIMGRLMVSIIEKKETVHLATRFMNALNFSALCVPFALTIAPITAQKSHGRKE